MNEILQLIMIVIGGGCIGISAKPGIWSIVAFVGGLLIVGSYYVG